MRSPVRIKHEFVEFIPKEREEGVLYISIPYATAVHNCFCGCGLKVVTPISPVGWQLTFDGETVTLWPSVGSWSFPCRSHYVIRRDTVVWAGNMSQDKIERGRDQDRDARNLHLGTQTATPAKTRKTKRGGKTGEQATSTAGNPLPSTDKPGETKRRNMPPHHKDE